MINLNEKNLELIEGLDLVITFGVRLENSELFKNKELVYMHPVDNKAVESLQYIKYEVGSEDGVCCMLLDGFAKECDEETSSFIEDLDIGYISAESNVGEEEIEELVELCQDKKVALILGKELFLHDEKENIKALLNRLEKFSDLEFVVLEDESLSEGEIVEPEELDTYNGTVLYKCLENEKSLKASSSFLRIAKVSDKDEVEITSKLGKIRRVIELDESLQGTIALVGARNEEISEDVYPYIQAKILRVPENE